MTPARSSSVETDAREVLRRRGQRVVDEPTTSGPVGDLLRRPEVGPGLERDPEVGGRFRTEAVLQGRRDLARRPRRDPAQRRTPVVAGCMLRPTATASDAARALNLMGVLPPTGVGRGRGSRGRRHRRRRSRRGRCRAARATAREVAGARWRSRHARQVAQACIAQWLWIMQPCSVRTSDLSYPADTSIFTKRCRGSRLLRTLRPPPP